MRWKRFIKKKPKKDGWYYCTVEIDDAAKRRVGVPLYWNSYDRCFRLYSRRTFDCFTTLGPYEPYVVINEDVIAWTTLPKLYSRKK